MGLRHRPGMSGGSAPRSGEEVDLVAAFRQRSHDPERVLELAVRHEDASGRTASVRGFGHGRQSTRGLRAPSGARMCPNFPMKTRNF